MTPVVWRSYLGAGALAACVVLMLPAAPRAVLLIVVSASAALAIVVGTVRHRPAARAAWWLVAAGQGFFALGDVLFSVNDLILHIEPFPSLADALYLAGYPVLAGGLALLVRRRSTTRDRPALLDAAIIASGFGLISWVLVMVPYFRDPELTLLELLVSLAYPVGDALLLALAAALAVAAGRRVLAYWLLVGNLVVTLVTDTAFSVLALRGADTGPTDVGYVVAYVLLGAAALHPSMVGLSELETVVYRITQEALHNVARHAQAGRLWLDLEDAGDQVRLEIRDDGVGFRPVSSSVLVRDGRLGLAGMRERVEMAGGSWQVDARPGAGVTLRASFHAPSAA